MQAHTDRWTTQKHNGSGPIYRMGRGIKITKKEKKTGSDLHRSCSPEALVHEAVLREKETLHLE